MQRRSIVLYSAGLDSSVCLAEEQRTSSLVKAVAFNYSQSNRIELTKVVENSQEQNFDLEVVNLRYYFPAYVDVNSIIPVRNLLFITMGVKIAVENSCNVVVVGSAPGDEAPDNNEEFINHLSNACQKSHGVSVEAPLLEYPSKANVVRRAVELRLDFRSMWPCRSSGPKVCMECKTCTGMIQAFSDLWPDIGEQYYRSLMG